MDQNISNHLQHMKYTMYESNPTMPDLPVFSNTQKMNPRSASATPTFSEASEVSEFLES